MYQLYLQNKLPKGWAKNFEGHFQSHYYGKDKHLKSRTFNTWHSMLMRTVEGYRKTNNTTYEDNKTKSCIRWATGEDEKHAFICFLEDMGERPEGMTLDRIDPHGHYTPDNCRWADAKTQARNKRKKV